MTKTCDVKKIGRVGVKALTLLDILATLALFDVRCSMKGGNHPMITWFNVGKLVNTHGIRGEVKVIAQTDFPEERFKQGSSLTLFDPEGKESIPVTVETARLHKNSYILKFKQFQDINEVERMKGWSLKINKDQLLELPEHEFYYYEIIGCQVVTEEGEAIGSITEILSPGANDVWVVQPPKGKPVYIPYIEDVVKQVDVANKRVVIHLMEGLI